MFSNKVVNVTIPVNDKCISELENVVSGITDEYVVEEPSDAFGISVRVSFVSEDSLDICGDYSTDEEEHY